MHNSPDNFEENPQETTIQYIHSRHAKNTAKNTPEEEKSEKYFGITKEGESVTREKTEEIAEIIEELPEGSAVILSGVSKAIRTRSTLEAQGDELRKKFEGRDDILFLSESQDPESKLGVDSILSELKSISQEADLEKNKDAKIVIQFPLWIKQFTAESEEWKEWSEYASEKDITKDSEVAKWIDAKKGPNPDKIAQGIIAKMKKEENFFRRFFPNRPILFLNVGHSGESDALITYLANNGEITKEGFKETGGKEIQNSEFFQLAFSPDGSATFKYRGKEYECPKEIFDIDKK